MCLPISAKMAISAIDAESSKTPAQVLTGSQQQGVSSSELTPCKRPTLVQADVHRLLRKLYLVDEASILEVRQLISFENQNFHIRLEADGLGVGLPGKEFLLKVITLDDASERSIFELQADILRFLRGTGFCCTEPLANVEGDFLSVETRPMTGRGAQDADIIQEECTLYLVSLLMYIPGEMISKIEPVPIQLCFDAGVKLAQMDKLLWGYKDIPDSFKTKSAKTEWSLECFPLILNHLDVVQDEERCQVMRSIVEAFQREVTPKIGSLRKCLIHGDYNDDNIIVVKSPSKSPPSTDNGMSNGGLRYDITGVIDFTDMTYSCLVFEVAVAMAYMLYWPVADPAAATAVLLAGFESVLPLTEPEWDVLYVCVMAQLVADLVLSLDTHRSQPDNQHVMVTQGGWEDVRKEWGDPEARPRVEEAWREVCNSYRNLGRA